MEFQKINELKIGNIVLKNLIEDKLLTSEKQMELIFIQEKLDKIPHVEDKLENFINLMLLITNKQSFHMNKRLLIAIQNEFHLIETQYKLNLNGIFKEIFEKFEKNIK